MHLKVRRDQPPTTDPTQHFPFRGLLGCFFRHRSRQLSPSKPCRGEGGSGSRRLRVPLPPAPLTSGGAAALPSIKSTHHVPAAAGLRHRRALLGGDQGGQPAALEPIYLNGRQRRVRRGRAALSCTNQLGETRMLQSHSAAGAAPVQRLTTSPLPHPPPHHLNPPWPYLYPSNYIKQWICNFPRARTQRVKGSWFARTFPRRKQDL